MPGGKLNTLETLAIAATVVVAVPMLGCMGCCGLGMYTAGTIETMSPEEAAKHPQAARTPGMGEICKLVSDAEAIFAAADMESSERLTQLCNAKDRDGVQQMIAAGKAFMVESGTRARVIGSPGWFVTEVRPIEGPHEGQSMILPYEFVVK